MVCSARWREGRDQGAQPGFVGVGNPTWWAAHAQNGGASGWDSSLSPDCPRENQDWADQQSPQISEQREEGRGKG
jgi:hypothetical protein